MEPDKWRVQADSVLWRPPCAQAPKLVVGYNQGSDPRIRVLDAAGGVVYTSSRNPLHFDGIEGRGNFLTHSKIHYALLKRPQDTLRTT